jgi:integrase
MLFVYPGVTPGMEMARLTTKSVEAIQGAAERREIPDGYLRGLYLVVQPSGSKSWAVRYRYGGRSRKHTLGSYPVFDLKTAREGAGKVLRAVSEGRDPEQRRSGSVEDAVAQFLERHCKDYRPRSLKETERLLRLYVLKAWHGRNIDAITRADVRTMLAGIKDAPVTANRVHSITRKLFNWTVENDIIVSSPVAGVRPPSQETSRDRVLTDAELRKIWQAAPEGPFGAIVKLAILTGQRRSEISRMEWAEIEGDTWTLSKERTKNGRQHEVPLSRQAKALLESQQRISDRFVFSYDAGAFNGFSKSKARLDAACGVQNWTLHDLRRTTASGMAKLGVSLVVIEKVLNHVSGSLAGIVGVYQRHEFAKEKRAALQKWADHVTRLARS